MTFSRRMNNQYGMSLVELMVALVIGLVLLAGVYQVFIGSTTSYRENELFSRLQENARFAMEIMSRNIRMAGYTGCASIGSLNIRNTLNGTDTDGDGEDDAWPELYDFQVGVEGYDWDGTIDGNDVVVGDYDPAFNTEYNVGFDRIVEGSDILTIRGVFGDPVYLTQIMGGATPSSSASLAIINSATDPIQDDDILLLSDCTGAAVLQATSAVGAGVTTVDHAVGAGTPGNWTADLGHPFVAGAELLKISSISFLVANNPVDVPSLYRTDEDSTEELVEGVERMEIRYGIDTDDDRQVDAYVTAAAVDPDWDQVIAIRVALLMQSAPDGKAPLDTASYDLDGNGVAEYDPVDDQRMRRVFKATFALRNRTL